MTAYSIVNAAALQNLQPEDISKILANFQAIASVINGNLDAGNMAVGSVTADRLAGYPADATKFLMGNGAWGAPTAGPVQTYGTAFPSSPADGAMHVLVDNQNNPSYHWQFRYNAGSTTGYPWEFIGGNSLMLKAAAGSGTISASIVIPRAGKYSVVFGGQTTMNGTGSGTLSITLTGSSVVGLADTSSFSIYNIGTSVADPLVIYSTGQTVTLTGTVTGNQTSHVWAQITPDKVN